MTLPLEIPRFQYLLYYLKGGLTRLTFHPERGSFLHLVFGSLS